jgi:hypothetical protein
MALLRVKFPFSHKFQGVARSIKACSINSSNLPFDGVFGHQEIIQPVNVINRFGQKKQLHCGSALCAASAASPCNLLRTVSYGTLSCEIALPAP